MRIKEEIMNQVTTIDEDLHTQLANVRISSNSMNEKLQTNTMKIANQGEKLESDSKLLESEMHKIKMNSIAIKDLKTIKLNKEIYDKEIARVNSEVKKIEYGQKYIARNLQATDNYIEKYYPITVHNYITETISSIIDNKKILGRLLKYDMKIYK